MRYRLPMGAAMPPEDNDLPPNPRTIEVRRMQAILLLGVFLVTASLGGLVWLFLHRTDDFVRVSTVMGAVLVGGRIPGILAGFEVGLGTFGTIVALGMTNTTWFSLVYPALTKVFRHVRTVALVERIFRRAEEQAVGQVQRVSALGAWGLPIFVWLPLPLTGAAVGAVLGLIMGMPRVRVFVVVLSSMWVGVITWTVLFDYLFLFTGRTGKIAAWIVTGAFLLYSLCAQRRPRR
jgi:uncharacterized membrane protein